MPPIIFGSLEEVVFQRKFIRRSDIVNKNGKNGVFVPAGELAGRTGSTIMHDLIYGAWKAGYLRLTGNIRLEQMDGGTIIFNVSKKSDRWE